MTEPQYGSARSDDDTWDIVTGVGYTALLVAGWRAVHTLCPQPLVRDDYARHFITASGDPYLMGLLTNPATSEDATAFPRLYAVQTRFFDEFFRSAAAGGIRQAVIIAAGLDCRTYRLDWPDGTTVFEVDQPKVLAFKASVLAAHGAQPKAHRKEVAADLREEWSIPLQEAGFDPHQPTAWSLEGVLPYLTGAAQKTLFTRLDELSASGSKIGIGALGSRMDQRRLVELEAEHPGVNMSGDVDFSALTYADDASFDPAAWLSDRGWAVDPVHTNPELQASYGSTPAVVDVRIDAIMHSQYITATR
ncbi:class I SAM-dependent methyltransferase [Mycobacterium botniense]|uniref:S-adenosyl-L-methionine-dependent methyltransferase n=1 Tax=Mycobacterium botniense TaxID=84962 RepID=A0A7I9Y1F8_9MYCO|nr:class I SAM-dependent methyltransferase [Mycobacterium botniense]GFG75905.1 putative S-adenosyl-L-methionine-dependent methyltransferase [Mycobacterium botniense]